MEPGILSSLQHLSLRGHVDCEPLTFCKNLKLMATDIVRCSIVLECLPIVSHMWLNLRCPVFVIASTKSKEVTNVLTQYF
jgi:hypothetical protein